jgi:hypothetical protein
MPRIFDTIEDKLLPVPQETLSLSDRADFCVGYFNLRGWKALDSNVKKRSGGPGAASPTKSLKRDEQSGMGSPPAGRPILRAEELF